MKLIRVGKLTLLVRLRSTCWAFPLYVGAYFGDSDTEITVVVLCFSVTYNHFFQRTEAA